MGLDPVWSSDTTVAAYVWEAERNGILTTEYSPDGSETPLASVFRKDDTVPGETKFYATAETLFRGRPVRPSIVGVPDALPVVEITVEEGQEIIWQHRVVKTLSAFGGVLMSFETLLFGRVVAGKPEIMQVWPNGERKEHASLAEAMQIM